MMQEWTDQEVVFQRAADWRHHRNSWHRQRSHPLRTDHQPSALHRHPCPILWCATNQIYNRPLSQHAYC